MVHQTNPDRKTPCGVPYLPATSFGFSQSVACLLGKRFHGKLATWRKAIPHRPVRVGVGFPRRPGPDGRDSRAELVAAKALRLWRLGQQLSSMVKYNRRPAGGKIKPLRPGRAAATDLLLRNFPEWPLQKPSCNGTTTLVAISPNRLLVGHPKSSILRQGALDPIKDFAGRDWSRFFGRDVVVVNPHRSRKCDGRNW